MHGEKKATTITPVYDAVANLAQPLKNARRVTAQIF